MCSRTQVQMCRKLTLAGFIMFVGKALGNPIMQPISFLNNQQNVPIQFRKQCSSLCQRNKWVTGRSHPLDPCSREGCEFLNHLPRRVWILEQGSSFQTATALCITSGFFAAHIAVQPFAHPVRAVHCLRCRWLGVQLARVRARAPSRRRSGFVHTT